MGVRGMLQLSLLLAGLCQAHGAPPPGDLSTSQEAGGVPVSQLRMLSLGLAHLLQGLEENNKQLERQGGQVTAELDGATKSLESFHEHSLQARRTYRQVRKDVQILRARGDRLWRVVRDLQKELDDLEVEQEATQRQINRILQRVKSLTGPRSQGHSQLDVSSVKSHLSAVRQVIMDKQARRLASVTSDVSARDRLIDRHLRYIDHLEKQVSERPPAALRADSDSDCV